MIDKNFYLENLSAFDILIEDEDRKQAEAVIFRVFSMLQRDKIWLREVATEEEIFEEDAEFLEEIEEELKELDERYEFRFEDFYQLVQQEMKKLQSNVEVDYEVKEDEFEDLKNDLETEDEQQDFYDEEEENEEEMNTEHTELLSHLSDEEIDLVPEYILASAKTRFNYHEFLEAFPNADEFFVEEEFLFPVIAGKAFGETDAEIVEKMLSNFQTSGYPFKQNDLLKMIAQKGKELGPEILAFKIASDSLNEGAHPTSVIQQISQLLRS